MPALRSMLPDLEGKRIVDLGCGFGWFARWARGQGAAEVLGIDLSENMLARARAEMADDAIRYLQADLDNLELPEAGFDLAYSSLAFHYVVDIARLFRIVSCLSARWPTRVLDRAPDLHGLVAPRLAGRR